LGKRRKDNGLEVKGKQWKGIEYTEENYESCEGKEKKWMNS